MDHFKAFHNMDVLIISKLIRYHVKDLIKKISNSYMLDDFMFRKRIFQTLDLMD